MKENLGITLMGIRLALIYYAGQTGEWLYLVVGVILYIIGVKLTMNTSDKTKFI
jgi:hypothetical protein